MHPLNIPELADLIRMLKSDKETEILDNGEVIEREKTPEEKRIDELWAKLIMSESFDPQTKARVYSLDKYRKIKKSS